LAEQQMVVFKVGDVDFGVSVERVQEIMRITQSTKIPDVPDYIEGIINLRGNIITVISLRKRFGLETVEYDDESRIIVLEAKDQIVGVIVDQVSEVLKIAMEAIEPAHQIFKTSTSLMVESIAKLPQRLIILPDLDVMLFEQMDECDFAQLNNKAAEYARDID